MKTLFKYLWVLAIILLRGPGPVSLDTMSDYRAQCVGEHSDDSNSGSFDGFHRIQSAFIAAAPSGKESRHDKIDIAENEIEEDELIPSRKQLDNRHCYTSALFAQSDRHLISFDNKSFSLYHHFSTRSDRYLVLEVFRI
jgi:hypothetical protein